MPETVGREVATCPAPRWAMCVRHGRQFPDRFDALTERCPRCAPLCQVPGCGRRALGQDCVCADCRAQIEAYCRRVNRRRSPQRVLGLLAVGLAAALWLVMARSGW